MLYSKTCVEGQQANWDYLGIKDIYMYFNKLYPLHDREFYQTNKTASELCPIDGPNVQHLCIIIHFPTKENV